MLYQWGALAILAEEVEPDEWIAYLEFDADCEMGVGTGCTEMAARSDLRNTLSRQARDEAEMHIAALDDKAHALTERRAGL